MLHTEILTGETLTLLKTLMQDGRLSDCNLVDVACLSTRLTLNEMLKSYDDKFKNTNEISPIKALTYYEDIKEKEPIMFISGKYDWKLIDKRLHEMTRKPDHLFAGDLPFRTK